MKKKSFLIIFLILCITVCIFCFRNTKSWSKKDLYIYDSSGQIIEKPHNWKDDGDRKLHAYLGASHCDNCREDTENGKTHKGVSLGDDALEALSKYNLEGAYLMGVGEDSGELADLEEAIRKHSSLAIGFYLDKSFNVLSREELTAAKQTNHKYAISFSVKEGKILSYDVTEMLER